MSFILDALRKSDAERQRTAAPGLADVRYAGRRVRQSVWVPILAAILAANVVLMGVQWFGRAGARPETAASVPASSGPAAETPATAAAPAPAIRPLAREAEFGEPLLEPDTDVDVEFMPEPQAVAEAPPVPLPQPPAPAVAPVAMPATPSRILAGNDLPTAEELIGTGALSIPLLNLDLHVYSAKPGNRFVVISSRKYKEGGQLSAGPTVESITRDGVILAYQGRRFTLARR
ncbi:MAG: hypothetical protein EXR82_02240 [Gammaproteobacteria bacterium]|nr:hypothetical protein [Gammaproteobacteria bacterium]